MGNSVCNGTCGDNDENFITAESYNLLPDKQINYYNSMQNRKEAFDRFQYELMKKSMLSCPNQDNNDQIQRYIHEYQQLTLTLNEAALRKQQLAQKIFGCRQLQINSIQTQYEDKRKILLEQLKHLEHQEKDQMEKLDKDDAVPQVFSPIDPQSLNWDNKNAFSTDKAPPQTPYATNIRKPMSQMVYKNEILEMDFIRADEEEEVEMFQSFELKKDDIEQGNEANVLNDYQSYQDMPSKPKQLVVDPQVINEFEIENKIQFDLVYMKNYIDKQLEESKSWQVKKESEVSKVRMKYGSDFHSSIPVIQHEHHFPDCHDPELILKALNEFRDEWDESLEACEELKQLTNDNTKVYRLLNKAVVGTAQREFLDKKIWFRSSDTLRKAQKEGSDSEDIYVWVTCVPDQFYEINKNYVRGHTLMGLNRFGKCKDGRPGCYFESIVQTDCKLNSWTMSLVGPLMPKGFLDWGNTVRSFLTKKQNQINKQ